MAWVVAEVDPFTNPVRRKQGLVSMHGGLYKRRSVLIQGRSRVTCVVTFIGGKRKKVEWTIHPKRRMQANIDSRRKRKAASGHVLSQDFRPWQQTKTYN